MGKVKQVVHWWAKGWAMFVEASRGFSTGGLAGPNPWGDVPRRPTNQARHG
jgi:hypothetical protein